ncbi:hypothetical protein NXC24_PC00434 (plasmid) [Rhizobium sp. NXC24]|nr:hypothetical protein NXC24_PC00434 [Rhizobium sp. NXC24]
MHADAISDGSATIAMRRIDDATADANGLDGRLHRRVGLRSGRVYPSPFPFSVVPLKSMYIMAIYIND